MTRVKRGLMVKKRHKRMLKRAKGYRGLRSKIFTQAKLAVMKAGQYSYQHRRVRRRVNRRLWIVRLNAALKGCGLNYSRFINSLAKKLIVLDRKVMADIAARYPKVFEKIVEATKE